MKKYRTSGSWSNEIEEVEITRETDKCVFYKGCNGEEIKEHKRTGYRNYFDSWMEAYGYLLERETDNVNKALKNLKKAQEKLKIVQAMKEPK